MISVTSGGYQYLHRGHRLILETAYKLGGPVIVLLNSDEYILQAKGYLGETYEIRKENLLKTGLVKEVRKIEDDPTTELEKIKPDFFVVGEDHTLQEIMSKGGNFCKNVVIVPRIPKISSTAIYKERQCQKEKRELE